nr:uncharacterized protein LOC109971675 isoform X2 [Monopterus albus]XP_020475727.1 uncharacterized protein LOC109971675 isoform X2 [Monopterus albus]XP_020475728.1 uncharacterized protein LOC109971675 isoform X2 [Monopterus albus]
MCLSMTKPQKCDEGLYGCEIYQGWDCTVVHNISLKVKDCKTIQGVKAAPGTLVELNCPVQIMAAQNISWAMLKGGNPVSITSTMFKMNDTLLAIHSVNVSDSGWYRCMYMLEQTQHCFDINLLVQVESVKPTTTGTQTQQVLTTTENVVGPSGAFITTVVSVVLGTLIVAVLTGLFIYCRCNTHRVRQQTQRDPAGVVQLFDGYETVDGVLSEDFLTRRNNTLYQDDGSISTFRY